MTHGKFKNPPYRVCITNIGCHLMHSNFIIFKIDPFDKNTIQALKIYRLSNMIFIKSQKRKGYIKGKRRWTNATFPYPFHKHGCHGKSWLNVKSHKDTQYILVKFLKDGKLDLYLKEHFCCYFLRNFYWPLWRYLKRYFVTSIEATTSTFICA